MVGNEKCLHQAARLRKRQQQAMQLGKPYGLRRDLKRIMAATAQMLGPKRVAWYDMMQQRRRCERLGVRACCNANAKAIATQCTRCAKAVSSITLRQGLDQPRSRVNLKFLSLTRRGRPWAHKCRGGASSLAQKGAAGSLTQTKAPALWLSKLIKAVAIKAFDRLGPQVHRACLGRTGGG